jgi:hypothetical protein
MELAVAAMDFELETDERDWLSDHLASCTTCRRDTMAYQWDARAIAQLPEISAPASVRARVLEPHTAGPRERWPPLAALGAAGLAAALAAILLLRPGAEPPQAGATGSPHPSPVSPSASRSPSATVSPRPSPPQQPSPSPRQIIELASLDWQEAVIPTTAVTGVRNLAVGPGLGLAILVGPGERPVLWSTADGATWADIEVSSEAFGGTAPFLIRRFRDGYFALGWTAGGRATDERRVWLSPDGLAWRPDIDPSGTLGRFSAGLAATSPEVALVGGRSPTGETVMWRSADAIGWEAVDVADALAGAVIEGLEWDGETFYAFGGAGGFGAIWQSADGRVWTSIEGPGAFVSGLTPDPDGLVAFGSTRTAAEVANVAWWSADGSRWERVEMPPLSGSAAAVIVDVLRTPAGLVAIWQLGPEGSFAAAQSANGRDWSFVPVDGLPDGFSVDTIEVLDDRLVLFGRGPGVGVFWVSLSA